MPVQVQMKNREPKWNALQEAYQLDFGGRATMASCKNIELLPNSAADTLEDVCFLMGKVEKNRFNIDFKAPFSAVQAFAQALVIFSNSGAY